MKRIFSLMLAFTVIICGFSISVSAYENRVVFGGFQEPTLYNSSKNHEEIAQKTLSGSISLSDLKNAVVYAISNCNKTVDLSEYSIPYDSDRALAISDYIFYSLPEAFSVNRVGFSYFYQSNIISSLQITYREFADTPDEYKACMDAVENAADRILYGVEENGNLDDVQKALIIHDRLAVWNEYDYSAEPPDESFTAYGALGKRVSVCQGYAMAYMYLLRRVGIENYYCSSIKLNHGWNIVKINGKPYHVDVTWDDYAWASGARGAVGTVAHDNFLLSTAAFKSNGHNADDFDDTPTDTYYDNYYDWQNSDSEFQLIDNKLYYIDNVTSDLKCLNDGEVLCKLEKKWMTGEYSYYGNYSRLASDGVSLYYSNSKKIYKYDIASKISTEIYAPVLDKYYNIYAFTYFDNCLICDINNVPPYSVNISPTENLYQIREKYENKPTASISGDIDGDGSINAKDLGLLMQYINGWSVTINVNVADLNGDSEINAKDYGLLMQFVNGWNVQIV